MARPCSLSLDGYGLGLGVWIENYNTRRFGWEAVSCRPLEVAQAAWSVEGARFLRYSGRRGKAHTFIHLVSQSTNEQVKKYMM